MNARSHSEVNIRLDIGKSSHANLKSSAEKFFYLGLGGRNKGSVYRCGGVKSETVRS